MKCEDQWPQLVQKFSSKKITVQEKLVKNKYEPWTASVKARL